MKHGLTRYKKGPDEHGTPGRGCRCPACSRANRDYQDRRARLIAYGRWDGRLDAAGTHRRIQALMWNGWSLGLLAGRLGCTRQVLRLILHRSEGVRVSTAAAVRALYDELWDQAPPEENRFERRNATMARRYARERGWVPVGAWDDDEIDDPAAAPAEGWERREGVRGYGGVLAEDAADLLGAGEAPAQVARRLGVAEATLTTVLARAQRKQAADRAA